MANPVWQTTGGDLGQYFTDSPLNIQLVAYPVLPSTQVYYTLLSGNLPNGLIDNPVVLDYYTGVISGIPDNIIDETVFSFTVRATDDFNNIRDRTFSITIVGSNRPYFYTPTGEILNVTDSAYIRYDIQFVNNISTNKIFISVTGGMLPPGLQILPEGTIIGYPLPPLTVVGSPTIITYNFTLQLSSQLGNDICNYSITIKNQSINQLPNQRKPAILNVYPLMTPVPLTDPYFEFYIIDGKSLPTVNSGDFFAFKVIGYDFDKEELTYNFVNLPPGVVGDIHTGWITGVITLPTLGKTSYNFSVTVHKTVNITLSSDVLDLSVTVINSLTPNVSWISNSNLGIINNATISELIIQAKSSETLNYQLMYGELPPNLILLPTGEIVGRVAQQASKNYMNLGDTVSYTFGVMAYSPIHHLITDTREFTITVYHSYQEPFENVYIKAFPDTSGREILYSLLNDDTLIPTTSLYRPTDPYFGKAIDVTCVHAYGMLVADANAYTIALQQNHYTRKIILGELQVAVARDNNFNVVYEVVYCKLVDDLSLNQDTSLPQTITWPRNINLKKNSAYVNNPNLTINDISLTTISNPGYVRFLNPASLINMRTQITGVIGRYLDNSVLPSWMTSQQLNGEPLGFLESWVLCYALPGKGQEIVDNINSNWPHTLNQIDFTVDRYMIDKSFSYNYNTNFVYPFWSNLPSASPVPNPLNANDLPVLFPRKTILPSINKN